MSDVTTALAPIHKAVLVITTAGKGEARFVNVQLSNAPPLENVLSKVRYTDDRLTKSTRYTHQISRAYLLGNEREQLRLTEEFDALVKEWQEEDKKATIKE